MSDQRKDKLNSRKYYDKTNFERQAVDLADDGNWLFKEDDVIVFAENYACYILMKRKEKTKSLRGAIRNGKEIPMKVTSVQQAVSAIKSRMLTKDLTASDLAEMTGHSKSSVSRWLSGKSIISTPSLINTCEALGIELRMEERK